MHKTGCPSQDCPQLKTADKVHMRESNQDDPNRLFKILSGRSMYKVYARVSDIAVNILM